MKCLTEDVIKIIADTIHVTNDKIQNNIPLIKQVDIDSLDCAEIDIEIQDKFNINFEFKEVVDISFTPDYICEKINKLLKKKEEEKNLIFI